MRAAQITIKLELVGDQAQDGKHEVVNVYADSNNLWETICMGFHELVEALKEHGRKLPSFGAKEHHDKQW